MNTGYLLREGWRNIGRRRTQFVLASLVVAACITLLTVFLIITVSLLGLFNTVARHGEVYAFITDAAAVDCTDLISQVAALDGVSEVRLVEKHQALEELKADLGEDADLLNALDENPLPASLRLTLSSHISSTEQLDALEQKLHLLPGITEVWSGREALVRLAQALRTAGFIDVVVLLLTAVCSIFIVFQTVESSIASRRSEIEIMELVGAPPGTVRFPFVLEGGIQGLCGGILAFLAVVLVHLVMRSVVPVPQVSFLPVFVLDALLGLLLGLAGSGIAVGKKR